MLCGLECQDVGQWAEHGIRGMDTNENGVIDEDDESEFAEMAIEYCSGDDDEVTEDELYCCIVKFANKAKTECCG